MSTRVEKYQIIYEKQKKKYGKCLTVVMGKFDGKQAAFLLQNMFPITEKYINHIHTKNGNPVPVSRSISKEIRSNLQQIRILVDKGKNIVFPDIKRLERIMINELEMAKNKALPTTHPPQKLGIFEDLERIRQEQEAAHKKEPKPPNILPAKPKL